jgi:acetyl esterase
MPLDPQVEAVVQRLNSAGEKPVEESTPAEARIAARDWLDLVGEAEHVAKTEHRFITGPTADLPIAAHALRIIHNSGLSAKAPAWPSTVGAT